MLAELAYAEADVALSVTADLPRAERMLRETINLCDDAGLQALGLLASSTLGQTLTMKGNAPAAVDILVRAASGWRRIGRSANLGWVLNNLGMAYLQVGDFESAVTVLTEAREEGERCKNPRNAAYAIASMGDAELALGHWDRARELYEDAIRICAEEAPDETLAALSICGLAGALLGLGDLQQADYFIQRAVLVATASSNSFEMATCRLQQAAVESASGDHATAVAMASEAVELFTAMDTQTSLCAAYYRLAMCQFKAGHRRFQRLSDVSKTATSSTRPWMVGALVPSYCITPMTKWVASRSLAGRAFREFIERRPPGEEDTGEEEAVPASRFPAVVARALDRAPSGRRRESRGKATGAVQPARKKLFFLFLANRRA